VSTEVEPNRSEDPRTPASHRHGDHAGYEFLVLGFSLLAVALLLVQYLVPVGAETTRLVTWVDTALCGLFFLDFVRRFAQSPRRWRYFVRTGWLDLLSSIPAVDLLRLARFARVLRIVRVIRLLMLSRELGQRLRERPRENALLTAAFACSVLLVTGAVAVLEFERVDGANIRAAGDALWWALTTITTVGYGDHAPITAGGRLVGAVLMLGGVGTFGVLAGTLASTLLGGSSSAEAPPLSHPLLQRTHDELQQLRTEVAQLHATVAALRGAPPTSLVGQHHAQHTAHDAHDERTKERSDEAVHLERDPEGLREPAREHEQECVQHEREHPEREHLHGQ
jgi:voltage-gated potassium channel